MNPDDAFERSLEALHAAALDDTRWPAASARIEEAIGVEANSLTASEGVGDDLRVHFAGYPYRGEGAPERLREYLDVYLPHDDGMHRLRQAPQDRLVHIPDLYTEAQLKTSPGYNEGLRLLGCRHGLAARFDEPDGLRIVWGVGDPVGRDGWESDRLRLVERLLPHVRRFVGVRQALAAADALGSGLAGLLDNDRIATVQLDRGGRVLAAKGPAREIAAATGWSEDYVRRLTKQVYRKLGATGQVELVRQVLAVDALPRR